MGWKRVNLTPEDVKAEKESKLIRKFTVLRDEHGNPSDAKLYRTPAISTKGSYFYFTPEAAEIASQLFAEWRAEEVEPPNIHDLTQLVP